MIPSGSLAKPMLFIPVEAICTGKHNGVSDLRLDTWGLILVVATITCVASVAGTAVYFNATIKQRVVVATTTSLFDTGLLDEVENEFEIKYNIDLCFVSVGTGIAIEFARRGDADMILVHSPPSEFSFLEEGYGVNRKIVAYNFFEIVGPETDPAGVDGSSPIEALSKIVSAGRNAEASWISRGDNSGTHSKEKALWKAAGFNWTEIRDETSWFIETGSGMGNTLKTANEMSARGSGAYTITDKGTFVAYSNANQNQIPNLRELVTQGSQLLNVYSAIAVNKTLHPQTSFEGATSFIKYLISEEGQQLVGDYGTAEYGQPLFYPAAEPLAEDTNPTVAQMIRDYAFFEGSECPEQYRQSHPELYPDNFD